MTEAEVTEVLALVEAAAARDAVAPLSEHVLLHLRYEGRGEGPGPGAGRDLLITAGAGRIAGYAYLDLPASAGKHSVRTAAASWWSTRTTGATGTPNFPPGINAAFVFAFRSGRL